LRAWRNRLKSHYNTVKAAYLAERGYEVPSGYRSAFVHWGGGADIQFIFARFLQSVPAGGQLLIIGVMGGRDYFLCRNLGYRVVALDLGPQADIHPILLCNVEHGLPFRSDTFDGVIVSEVLEHLVRDGQTLMDIRRVLKPGGRLIVSLPYYNDWEEGHVRVHSPWSARRLLNVCGFQIEDYLERPALIWPGRLNMVLHGLSLLSYRLRGRTMYRFTTELAGRIEYRCGHLQALRRIRRFSRHYGGYYLCARAARWITWR
jgi:SAM-dependent methyltransferase